MERIAALDLLRGLAALAVAIPHFIMLGSESAGPAEVVSVLAVEVFFVLSGFVLGPQILRCMKSGRAGDLGVFLTRRWMRTVPPYLFALALISTIVGKVGLADVVRYAFYLQNVFAQHNTSDYFPIAWSLSIEEWFYVTFPGLLMAAAWCFRNNKDRFAILAALLFIGTVTTLRLLFGDLNDWGPAVRRVVVFRLDSIAYGFLLYMAIQPDAKRAKRALNVRLPLAAALFAVSSAIACWLTWRILATKGNVAEFLYPFAAASFGMSAVTLAYSARDLFRHRFWLSETCYFLGRVSYSLYLFHLSIAIAVAPSLARLPTFVQLLVYLFVCIGVSAVFYRVFERPILAMRPGYRRADESGPVRNSVSSQ